MNEQEINRKIQAANILGLTVKRSYEIANEEFFGIFKVYKDENLLKTYRLEMNKVEILLKYNQTIANLQTQITFIQDQIDLINEVE